MPIFLVFFLFAGYLVLPSQLVRLLTNRHAYILLTWPDRDDEQDWMIFIYYIDPLVRNQQCATLQKFVHFLLLL